jgi:N-acyl-D-amino-acid deacylase
MFQDAAGPRWETQKDLTSAQLEEELWSRPGRGYRPALLAGYADRGESRYVAVWVQDALALGPRSGPAVPELAAFDDAMRQFMGDRDIPTGALAVMKDGKLLLARGYGFRDREQRHPVAADAPFRLASVTKAITNAAVHQLIREGKLRLDTRVAALLELAPPPGKTLDPRWQAITIQHLLEHKGGWNRDRAFDPMFRPLEIATALGKPGPASSMDVVRYMAGQPLQFAPGKQEVYSNFGYCLLGRVIEKVRGRSYINYVRDELLGPLGIKSVALGRSLPADHAAGEPFYCDPGRGRNVLRPDIQELVPEPDGGFYLEAMDAHGGLIGSAVDVVRFLHAYSLAGPPRAGKPVAGCYFGRLPGTFTMARQRADGVEIAALFNQSHDPSGLAYGKIREMLDKAADSIRTWPIREVHPSSPRADSARCNPLPQEPSS